MTEQRFTEPSSMSPNTELAYRELLLASSQAICRHHPWHLALGLRVVGLLAWVVLVGLGGCRFSPPDADEFVLASTSEGSGSSSGAVATDEVGSEGSSATSTGEDSTSIGGSSGSTDEGSDTGAVCGDGVRDDDEACDGVDLAGQDCIGLGFDGGLLACLDDCSGFDTSGCGTCGNGIVDGDESCDGPALDGNTCATEGFDSGLLACAADCLSLDPSGCGMCGNGMIDGAEACDGLDLGGQGCGSGFDSGSLACLGDCSAFDFGGCGTCGNDVIDGDEFCDGVDVGGQTCESQGFASGILGCDVGCGAFDTTNCDTCGNGVTEGVESCDGMDLGMETCASQGFVWGTLACTPACTYDVGGCTNLPGVPVLMLGFSQVKRFDFSWAAVVGADYYQLEESAAPGEPFVQLGGDAVGTSVSHEMPLHFRFEASYRLRACNVVGCTESAVLDVMSSLAEAVGYGKASNAGSSDQFGVSVAMSGDGYTLAIGANGEDSNATGIDGNQADNSSFNSGAVYVFVRDGLGAWSQQAYIKASNTGSSDEFGVSVALSEDGNTLAVGAHLEDSNATGVDGNQASNASSGSGAVYMFARDGLGTWSQQAYVKASNTGSGDQFGVSVTLSGDGNTLAVGARWEDSSATGSGGNQADNSSSDSGAVYVFERDGMGIWSQQAYVKASNTGSDDQFGWKVVLSGDGYTLGVGAILEASSATGIGGNQADNSSPNSGAVYVFERDDLGTWLQQAYVKASNTGSDDYFGSRLALSGDGHTLAVSAYNEDSSASDIGGNQADNSASDSGAVYVFARDGMGVWSQQAYVKASNTDSGDWFGYSVALSGDGYTLAVGANHEDSNATGIGDSQADNSASNSGAVYVFVRDGLGIWSHQTYIKASNAGASDLFGYSVALNEDGYTLAIGGFGEDSSATGIGGNQADNSSLGSGAVYLY